MLVRMVNPIFTHIRASIRFISSAQTNFTNSLPQTLSLGRSALKLAFTKGSTVTDSIRAYADQKLTKPIDRHADLLRDGSNSVEVQLKVETRGRHDEAHLGKEEHIAECTVLCTNKHTIHCTASTNDMYASLDDLTDTLTRKLRKLKERKADVKQSRRRDDKEAISGALIEDPDDDLEGASGRAAAAPVALVRRKSFAMDPITVEDAIGAYCCSPLLLAVRVRYCRTSCC